MTVTSTIIILCLSVFGVASLMEFYKKTIRKGNSQTWENWLVGGVLSFGTSALIVLTGMLGNPLPFNLPVWAGILIFGAVFFFVQMFVDMKIIKQIVKSVVSQKDVAAYADILLSKVGLSLDKVRDILKNTGITEEKFREYMKKIEIADDDIEVLVKLLYYYNEG